MPYGEVVSVPINVAPPTKNSTFVIGRFAFVGVAFAETVMLDPPAKTALFAGAVSETERAEAALANATSAMERQSLARNDGLLIVAMRSPLLASLRASATGLLRLGCR